MNISLRSWHLCIHWLLMSGFRNGWSKSQTGLKCFLFSLWEWTVPDEGYCTGSTAPGESPYMSLSLTWSWWYADDNMSYYMAMIWWWWCDEGFWTGLTASTRWVTWYFNVTILLLLIIIIVIWCYYWIAPGESTHLSSCSSLNLATMIRYLTTTRAKEHWPIQHNYRFIAQLFALVWFSSIKGEFPL